MSSPQLDYAAPDSTARLIAAALEKQERLRRNTLLVKLAFGVPASFIAPAFIAWIAVRVAGRWHVVLDYWPAFVVLSLVLLPLIYWRAALHRTDFIGEAAAELGIGSADVFRTSSYGEWELRSTWLSWAFYAEIFLWGPYVVLEAYHAWRSDRSALLACRERAIQVVRELWREDGGMPVSGLLSPAERPAALHGALAYLAHFDWVDLSERKDRVWLLTEARERLKHPSHRPIA